MTKELDSTQDAEIKAELLEILRWQTSYLRDKENVSAEDFARLSEHAETTTVNSLLKLVKSQQQAAVDRYDPITDSEMRLWMTEEQFKKKLTAHTDQVIGPDDPLQLASDAPGHIRYIQQVERNKLRREQRKRNKA